MDQGFDGYTHYTHYSLSVYVTLCLRSLVKSQQSTHTKKISKEELTESEYHNEPVSLPGTCAVLRFSSITQTDVCHKVGPLPHCPVRSQHLFLVIADRWQKASTCFPCCKVEVPRLPPPRRVKTQVACLQQTRVWLVCFPPPIPPDVRWNLAYLLKLACKKNMLTCISFPAFVWNMQHMA